MRSRVDALFFAETDRRNVGLFRLLYCLLLARAVQRRQYGNLIDQGLIDVSQFPGYLWQWHGVAAHTLLRGACIASLVLAAAGLRPRIFLALSLLAYFLGYYPVESQLCPNDGNLSFFVLLILMMAPGIEALSPFRGAGAQEAADRMCPVWPLQTIRLCLGLVYFAAMVSKMVGGWTHWLDGEAVQAIITRQAIAGQDPIVGWVGANYALCRALGIASLLFESTFIVVVFVPRAAWLFVPAGVLFHVGARYLVGADFLQQFIWVYLVFLTPFPAGRRVAPASPGDAG